MVLALLGGVDEGNGCWKIGMGGGMGRSERELRSSMMSTGVLGDKSWWRF